MIKNAYITIVASAELSELRLDELVGRRGLVVEDLASGRIKNRGALVLLEEAYMEEFLWFIPENAAVYE
ncbi:hypothetical protein GAP53_08340 [Bacteroides uniformis]|uniref:Uncharacterized protein n=2 Tax=Bacteroides TaxID=816 RepID=A0AAW7WMU8_9BACE|nr:MULTISPECIES: hypothetical protein [Bacteroides]KAB4219464.1 hypothetical protein GAP45_13475 [Bacteroides uniformis]KAB4222937.1 hypothetical protein GAP53_08340 [Bacteroides uniformis]KAB4225241.1 hypothetical protein GAP44_19540 [Bacteroides uniformis]KAB4236283.1 hypothetical protein GAP54_19625 [Bacteroides uniformis]KAB4241643.1 hypothetical protein GAP41_12935 [Bacteroides uniformis]